MISLGICRYISGRYFFSKFMMVMVLQLLRWIQ
jgi:hypothetical protein